MAIRGKKPKSTKLKLITGNPGKRPLPASNSDSPVRTDPLDPPKKLTKAQDRLWKRFVDTAWWLTDFDVPKAHMWVCLQAELLQSPKNMVASRMTQLRVLGSELGLDPSSRERLGVRLEPKADEVADLFDP